MKYIKKATITNAMQYSGVINEELELFCNGVLTIVNGQLVINDTVIVNPSEYIIKSLTGALTAQNAILFERTYELVQ